MLEIYIVVLPPLRDKHAYPVRLSTITTYCEYNIPWMSSDCFEVHVW